MKEGGKKVKIVRVVLVFEVAWRYRRNINDSAIKAFREKKKSVFFIAEVRIWD